MASEGYQDSAQLDSIYVSGLTAEITDQKLYEAFNAIGLVKNDENGPRIWIYKDPQTEKPTGDAAITYENPADAKKAIDHFNGKMFMGTMVRVEYVGQPQGQQQPVASSHQQSYAPRESREYSGSEDFRNRDRGSGPQIPRHEMRQGDWLCPKCNNHNFARRSTCNRCAESRPESAGPAVDTRSSAQKESEEGRRHFGDDPRGPPPSSGRPRSPLRGGPPPVRRDDPRDSRDSRYPPPSYGGRDARPPYDAPPRYDREYDRDSRGRGGVDSYRGPPPPGRYPSPPHSRGGYDRPPYDKYDSKPPYDDRRYPPAPSDRFYDDRDRRYPPPPQSYRDRPPYPPSRR